MGQVWKVAVTNPGKIFTCSQRLELTIDLLPASKKFDVPTPSNFGGGRPYLRPNFKGELP